MAEPETWRISDELWEQVAPLIPPAPPHTKGGRPRMDDRKAFTAIMYVLRTGIRWGALPRDMGASSTVHSRFLEWLRAGLFKAIHDAGLTENEDLSGINWDWQRTTAITTHVPFRRASGRQVLPGHSGSGASVSRPMESKAAQSY